MARRRDVNDIDYSDNKPTEILPEEKFRRRPAPDLGAIDTSQPLEFSVLREDGEILVRSNQAFRGEVAVPVGLDLPKVPTHRMVLEGVQWDLAESRFRNVFDFLANLRVAELTKIVDDENLLLTH